MKPLILLPALHGERRDDGAIGVTGKFLSGVEAYARAWDGPVKVWMEARTGSSGNLDDVAVRPGDQSFELAVVDYGDLPAEVSAAGVVLGSLGHRQNALPSLLAKRGVPFVTTSEYSLRTRWQIVDANTRNPILRARRRWWELFQERANMRAVRASSGVQCNGTPTYEAYARESPAALLYFDTRTHADSLLATDALEARLERPKAPVRLMFSGRLDRMKGAHLLPAVASALRARGVDFALTVCGGGSEEAGMRREVAERGLGDCVTLRGVLDFQRELVPLTKEQDLFLCPHLQGDPSCTYMETFACGVPIVGFDNEAFHGLCRRGEVGWSVPLGDVEAMASAVQLALGSRLAERSRAALAMASEHTYEATFARRVDHLVALAR